MKKTYLALLSAILLITMCIAPGFAEFATPAIGTPTATVQPSVAPTQTPTQTPARSTPEVTMQPTASPTPVPMPKSASDLIVETYLDSAQGNVSALEFEKGLGNADHYSDFYFDGNRLMQGISSLISRYVYIPSYCIVTEATLCLSYTSSDLILTRYSSLTLYLNGTPFYSCPIIADSSDPTILYVRVPVELFQDEYNLLEIAGYARLTDDVGCMDDYSNGNWVQFGDASCLRVGYRLAKDSTMLRHYPYPYISMNAPQGQGLTIAVSDEADEDEMRAALTVMASLGTKVQNDNLITFAKISDHASENLIYFGLASNTPSSLLALLGEPVPQTGAIIKRVDQGGKSTLLILSNEKQALLEAAQLLSDTSRVKQLTSDHAFASVGDAAQLLLNTQLSDLVLDDQYTLKSILGHGISFVGPFHSESVVTLPVSEDYLLSAESKFTMKMRYSENLDFDRSLMTVYWGETYIPLVSKKLTKEAATGDSITFSVPVDLVGKAGKSLVIAFELEIKDMDCTPRQMNMPWAYVSEDSVFYLPENTKSITLDLGYWPSPFGAKDSFNDIRLVLPDSPTAEEMNLAGQTLAAIGASDPYGKLSVVRASNFDPSNADANIIVVGLGRNNPMIMSLNDQLHFKYQPSFDAIASNEHQLLSDSFARTVGSVQLLSSPYAQNRALLVVTAPNKIGLQSLTELMRSTKRRWSLERDALLIDEALSASIYRFTADEAVLTQTRPSIVAALSANREPMIFALVGIGSMLVLLIGTLLVLMRIRKRKNKEE